ncbi:MAG: hypothetical protein ACJ76F_00110 [Bacteroidia bacterium]
MKKVLSMVAIAAMTALVACGPSAEEKAKMEADLKAKTDSAMAAMSAMVTPADTTAMPADSTATTTTTTEEKK